MERFLPSTLRGRFLAVLFGVLLPSLTLFGVLHHDSVRRSLTREVDQTLVNRAREVEQVLRASGIRSPGDFSKFHMVNSALMLTSAPEVYVDIIGSDGATLWASQNLVGKSIPLSSETFKEGDSLATITQPDGLKLRRMTRTIKLQDGTDATLVLAESLTHLDSALRSSVGRTALLGFVVLSLTEFLGNIAFRGLFTPLNKLVDTTETIVTTGDVTRRVPVVQASDPAIRRTAVAFNLLMDRVEQLLEMAKRLLADTSHELRNPLTVLMTDLDLLRENLEEEQREEVVAEAQTTVRRLNRLVNDLLLLSRSETQSEPLDLQLTEVKPLVEKVVHRFARSVEKDTAVHYRDEAPGNPSSYLNPERTEQILTNLLENAVRYSDQEVNVLVLQTADDVVISIQDKGCGISVEEQEKIFHRFYRVDRSRDRHSGGTGLGLAVARALARQQSGDVTVQSVPGEGSDFRVRFPLV